MPGSSIRCPEAGQSRALGAGWGQEEEEERMAQGPQAQSCSGCWALQGQQDSPAAPGLQGELPEPGLLKK